MDLIAGLVLNAANVLVQHAKAELQPASMLPFLLTPARDPQHSLQYVPCPTEIIRWIKGILE